MVSFLLEDIVFYQLVFFLPKLFNLLLFRLLFFEQFFCSSSFLMRVDVWDLVLVYSHYFFLVIVLIFILTDLHTHLRLAHKWQTLLKEQLSGINNIIEVQFVGTSIEHQIFIKKWKDCPVLGYISLRFSKSVHLDIEIQIFIGLHLIEDVFNINFRLLVFNIVKL